MARQEPFRTSSFQEAACSSSLSTKTFDSNNFQDSSLTEETFSKTTSQTAAWQKRASDRQLLRQQLGRRDLQKATFRDSSLEDETFSTAASKQAAWKRHFALAPSKRAAFNRAASKQAAWTRHFALAPSKRAALNRGASKRTAWKTAASKTAAWKTAASFRQGLLTTELAQLKTSSFEKSPACTAQLCFQLCFREASFSLGGGSCRTSTRRGGVLRTQLAFLSLHLAPRTYRACLMPASWLKLRQLAPHKGACSLTA